MIPSRRRERSELYESRYNKGALNLIRDGSEFLGVEREEELEVENGREWIQIIIYIICPAVDGRNWAYGCLRV